MSLRGFVALEEEYMCLDCGFKRTIWRNQRRKKGHIKTMLCVHCGEDAEFINL